MSCLSVLLLKWSFLLTDGEPPVGKRSQKNTQEAARNGEGGQACAKEEEAEVKADGI